MYYTIGGFTLDDTVLPTGEIRWSAPGGNALYSAVGARIWGAQVGIITPVGEDYPQEYLDRLADFGFDLSGVWRISYRSFHVWVLHEGSGTRQIFYRLDSGVNAELDPRVEHLPPEIGRAKGVHICPILGASQAALVAALLEKNLPVFLDLIQITNQIDIQQGHRQDYWPRLRALLPSIEEVRLLWGNLPLADLLQRMQAAGPEIFAIKMGHRGSVVRNPKDGQVYHVPAYPAEVIDATGAGDSFCGGFMAGLQETGDAIMAALQGTVSASFLIEDFGALHAMDITLEKAQERLESLRSQVKPIGEVLLEGDRR